MSSQIIYNAKIYTLDPTHPNASAIAIQKNRIIALGDEETILAEFGEATKSLDVGGLAIIPGLTDAHIHLNKLAANLDKVDCSTPTRAQCLERVAAHSQDTPPGEWLLGHGWNQNFWPEGYGTASDLDIITPGHPVYLTAQSLHAAWANSEALRRAGINATTPDPPGGRIGRRESGQPNGLLFEKAMELVDEAIPKSGVEDTATSIAKAIPQLWRMGLTGAHDFDRRACFSALQLLHHRGELKFRVTKSIPVEDLAHAIALGLRSGFGDDTLRVGGIKAFADGALGPRTAAMIQPYTAESDNFGILLLDAEELYELGLQAVENGLSLAIHAIGDRANHEVLNAIGELRRQESNGSRSDTPLRHRLEHVQVIHPDDAGRYADLDVIASMQPVHIISDMFTADRYWGDRAAYSYAWRTQLDHGTRLAFGSDAPVESPNPFWGLHAAVTRRQPDGEPGVDGWYPQQKITLSEALKAYTSGAAYATYMEDRLGILAPNYLADLLVLDTDPFTAPPDKLREIKPVATMIGGEWVFKEL